MSRTHHESTPLRLVLLVAGLVASAALVACGGRAVSPTDPRGSASGAAPATQVTTGTGPVGVQSVTPDPNRLGPVAPGVQLPVRRDSDFCYYDNAGYCLSQTGNPLTWDYSSKNGLYKACVSGNTFGRCAEGTLFSCYCKTP